MAAGNASFTGIVAALLTTVLASVHVLFNYGRCGTDKLCSNNNEKTKWTAHQGARRMFAILEALRKLKIKSRQPDSGLEGVEVYYHKGPANCAVVRKKPKFLRRRL